MAAAAKQKGKEKQPPMEPDQTHSPSGLSWQQIVGITAVIISLALLWVFRQPVWDLLSLVGDQQGVSNYLKGFGLWGPLVLALVQLIQILVAVIPGHVFLIAAGYVYGFPLGLLLNVVYIVAASQFSFSLASLYQRQKKYALAAKYYSKALKHNPGKEINARIALQAGCPARFTHKSSRDKIKSP